MNSKPRIGNEPDSSSVGSPALDASANLSVPKTPTNPVGAAGPSTSSGAARQKSRDQAMTDDDAQFEALIADCSPKDREMFRNSYEINKMYERNRPRLAVRGEGQSSYAAPEPFTASEYHTLMEVLGQTDIDFVSGIIEQISSAHKTSRGIDEHKTNFILSFIKRIAPKDSIEVLLAAQMATVHQAVMASAHYLNNTEYWDDRNHATRAINQLGRTFVAQMGALKHHRTGGEQKVTVQHVSVSDGGQAIVSQVNQSSPPALEETRPTPVAHAPQPSFQMPPKKRPTERVPAPMQTRKARRR